MQTHVPAMDGERPYTAGSEHTLSLPGLSGKQRIRITSVETQRLGLVTWGQVRQEVGTFRSRGAWQQSFVRRFDKAWCRRWTARLGGLSGEDLERRFRARWAKTDCWVLGFVLLDDRSRFLANQRRRPSTKDGQYTHRSDRDHAIDTLPVIDPSPELVEAARAEGERLRASFRADLEQARRQRVADGPRAAKKHARAQLRAQRTFE